MTSQRVTGGWQRWAQSPVTAAQDAPTAVSLTAPTGHIVTEGARGVRFQVLGDTDGDNAELMIYGIERIGGGGTQPKVHVTRPFVDLNTWTIGDGTTKGVEGTTLAKSTEFWADTVDPPTLDAYGTQVLKQYNGLCDEYSPTSNLIAEAFISDLGDAWGILPRFDTLTTGDYFVLLYKLDFIP